MEKLYATVLEFADLKGGETVFDLYCGVGTIGLYCAQRAKYVWGIESVKSAVIDANRNAVINGLVNIRFICGRAEDKIVPLIEEVRKEKERSGAQQEGGEAGESSSAGDIPADIVIVDPPRAGCKPELLLAVMEAGPEKIIYVSCDPGTLMRDLKYLTGMKSFRPEESAEDAGPEISTYEIRRIRQIDQFCHSMHVECVVLMSKVKE